MILIHGDNQIQSRNYLINLFSEYKLKNFDLIKINGNELDLTILKQHLESLSLWNQQKAIIIEYGIPKFKEDVVKYLNQSESSNLIMWDASKLTSLQLKKFPKAEIKEFKPPNELFTFLDLLGSTKKDKYIYLDKLLKSEDDEFIFVMTHRRLRHMIYLSLYEKNGIDSIEKLATWQIAKLKTQTKILSKEALISKYIQFINFDYHRKIGKTGLTVKQFLYQII